jgi:hypothetical protein
MNRDGTREPEAEPKHRHRLTKKFMINQLVAQAAEWETDRLINYAQWKLRQTYENIYDILKKELKHININPHHKKTHKRISI